MANLKVLYDVNRVNLPVPADLIKLENGNLNSYDWVVALKDYKEGIVVELDENGAVVPATGSNPVIGFLLQDTAGLFLENPAAQASGLVAVTLGDTMVEVDGEVAEALLESTPGAFVSADANGVLKEGAAGDAAHVGVLVATSATDKTVPAGAIRVAVK